MTDNYQILISKLDEFIRKYYKNLMIRGLLYCIGLLILFFLAVTALEYTAHLNTIARTVLFYAYIVITILIIGKLIVVPLFKLFKIGRIISHEQAAEIIGEHFSNVKDKLLNTLQLKKLEQDDNRHLIEASINQKIENLKPVPFKSAIDIKKNRKYLKYSIPPVAIALIILLTAPGFITEPAKRIVKHNTYFERELPFELVIQNEKLEAIQQEDFVLNVNAAGEELPSEIYVGIGNNIFKASKINASGFKYIFKNIQRNVKFYLVADRFRSEEYELKVLVKPIILNFDVELDYPDYIDKKVEVVENKGDLLIPEGTYVTWKFYTRDTESVLFRIKEELHRLDKGSSNTFIYIDTLYRSSFYSVNTQSRQLKNKDSLSYTINVIEDGFPSIIVEEYRATVFENRIYFSGGIKDDYGFRRLAFRYKKLNDDIALNEKETENINVDINRSLNQQQFYHYFDVTGLEVNPGDEIEYWFEVWDNDGVNGSKSSRSHKMYFRVPTVGEIEASTDKSNEDIKEEIEKAISELQMLKDDINAMNMRLLEKNEMSWQDQQQLQDLIQRQEDIQNRI